MSAIENPRAFDPKLHMEAPFRAFLEAAQKCADRGHLVFLRPDPDGSVYDQQLIIVPAASLIAARKGSDQ